MPRTPRSRLPPRLRPPRRPRPCSAASTASRSRKPTSNWRSATSTSSSPACRRSSAAPRRCRRSSRSGCSPPRRSTDGLDKTPEFQRRIEFLRERTLHSALVEADVAGKITDAEIRARYDQEVANTPPVNEVHARHILVKTKEEAVDIIKQLDGGAKFEDIAKAKSSDGSAAQGGDLGWFGPGQMVPEFEKAVFALEVGAYTKEPVQTQFGWHVIKVEDKRTQQPPAFDKVKDQVRSVLLREKYFALVKSVRAGAKVEIADPELKKGVEQVEKSQ